MPTVARGFATLLSAACLAPHVYLWFVWTPFALIPVLPSLTMLWLLGLAGVIGFVLAMPAAILAKPNPIRRTKIIVLLLCGSLAIVLSGAMFGMFTAARSVVLGQVMPLAAVAYLAHSVQRAPQAS